MTVFNVFSLLGGLALFLFGMDIMGKALEASANTLCEQLLAEAAGKDGVARPF